MAVLAASACDDADGLAAPRARPGTSVRAEVAAAPETGAGPMLSGVALNMCADVDNASRRPGTRVHTWTCNGYVQQQLALYPSGEIKVYNGTMCLDADGGRGQDGDGVNIWTCNGYRQQRWTRTARGEIVGVGGKCLDVSGAQTTNGGRLIIWTCHGGANQRWTVRDAVSGTVAAPAPVVPVAPTAVPVSTAASSEGGTAELPRTYLETAMPAATGRTIAVAAGGDLQAALDAAQPGDVVTLAPGAAFTGNFVLRPKAAMTAAQWITVRTAGLLPAEGTRVGPADAAQMPKLQTPNNEPALATAPGTQGWRLVGLEITAAPAAANVGALVALGTAGAEQATLAQVPGRLVLDRSYVHGAPTLDLRRCVALNSAASAIIDSYLGDCHSRNGDSQAILGWNGPGPYKIVNNHLEGGHEVIMFGGGDPSVRDLVPGDIELRRNHVTRPLSWRGVWQVKNLFELKNARRVLAEGNVFENNWADAQVGFGVVFTAVNQDGGCAWCTVQDVTFRYNRVLNTPQGFNIAAQGSSSTGAVTPVVLTQRVTIAHNVVTGATGRMVQLMGALAGLAVTHNTAVGGSHDVYFATPEQPLPTFVFRDNVTGGYYTLFADGTGQGDRALAALQVPAGNVAGNVFAGGQTWNLPAGNAYAASADALGFVSLGGGDLSLSLASPFRTSGTGGSTPGADFTALNRVTSGVVR